MSALRKALAALFLVFATVAFALTPGERIVLFSGIHPVWQANFLGASSLPAGLTWTVPTTLRTLYDSTGKLTYGGNNQLTYSNTFSNGAWNKATATLTSGIDDPFGGTAAWTFSATGANSDVYQQYVGQTATNYVGTLWVRRRSGSGAVKLITAAGGRTTITVTASWTQVYATAASVSGNPFFGIEIATNGDAVDIYAATSSAVTYETTPRSVDQVITTSAAYYAPRFDYDPSTLAPRGLLVEEARTNVALYSRDMTNAAWVKSSITAALNQTGLDGVANSASSITASGANGTILQTVTLASSQRFYSAYVKRITGSGAVSMTTDNGTTWTAITVTGSWTQVSIPAQTVTNPVFGFKLATNGDAIAVDCNQNEGGAFATSAIITTSTSVQRTTDVIAVKAPITTVINSNNGAIITEFGPMNQAGSSNPVILGSSNSFIQAINSSKRYGLDTFRAAGVVYDTNTLTLTNTNRGGITWGPSSYSFADNGNTVVTGSGTTAPYGIMYLGAYNNLGGGSINGYIRSIAAYNQRLPDPTLKARSVVGAPW